MEAKVENILSADIENLAERRGEEAVEWAIAAVREAEAATASRALELGVIDYIASDVPDLLTQMDGFVVTVRGEGDDARTRRMPSPCRSTSTRSSSFSTLSRRPLLPPRS